MSQRQNTKMQIQKKQADREMKYLTVHSKSRDKSSSGDQKKNDGSLKRIFYKHQIFDKRNSPIKFKPLNRIKEEEPEGIQKYNSSQQLNWKDKVIGILEKQQGSRNEQNKNSQREKMRTDSSKSGSRENSVKNIEILQIENHQIADEMGEIKEERHKTEAKQLKSSVKQKPQEVRQKASTPKQTPLKQSSETLIQIIKVQKHAFHRDEQIFEHKYQSNLKFLMAQASQLLSYNKHMLLEQQISQAKRQMSQLSIFIRRLKIDMRNHDYTKEINFTFPVEKHNDQIMVKMPGKVQDKQMKRYFLMAQKLQSQNALFAEQQAKIDSLQAYHQTLLKKYDAVLQTKLINQTQMLSGSKKSITDSIMSKLAKSKSSQSVSIKSSHAVSSLASSNSRSPIKNAISHTKVQTPVKGSESEIQYDRYQTLIQKKQALKEGIEDMKAGIDVKLARLMEQIKLLKQQMALIDSNIKTTEESKAKLTKQIENARKRKDLKQQTIESQYEAIANQRKVNYEKQKQKRHMETKGFTMFLRSNKSLSPVNYVSSPSNKVSANHSPRDIKKPEKSQATAGQHIRKNIQNVQSAKLIKASK